MNQDKSPVSPENRAPFQSPGVKLLVNGILNNHLANQRCMKQLAQECGSMPYPANRKIVKMIVMPGGNKRQVFQGVFQEVLQDFLPQDLVMRWHAF
jgi:hypothetical protein